MRIASAMTDIAVRLSLETVGRGSLDRLLRAAQDPLGAQQRALSKILSACADTELGHRYGLSDLRGVDAFRARVPISDYEALRALVSRQIESGAPIISATQPIMYARTSGTTGAPKYIRSRGPCCAG
jgi:hypothetical protein